jgi:hypothetical protein
MTRDTEQKYVGWTWIVSILCSILLLGLTAFIADLNNRVNQKVDRRELDMFVAQAKDTWCRIDTKLNQLIDMHLEQNGKK